MGLLYQGKKMYIYIVERRVLFQLSRYQTDLNYLFVLIVLNFFLSSIIYIFTFSKKKIINIFRSSTFHLIYSMIPILIRFKRHNTFNNNKSKIHRSKNHKKTKLKEIQSHTKSPYKIVAHNIQ